MIIDCHTHIWESVEQLGRGFSRRFRSGSPGTQISARPQDHLAATQQVDRAFVLAFKSHYLDADVPNEFVAEHVRRHADRFIGFASVDPSRPQQAIDELRRAHNELGMQGVMIWPAAQDIHPSSTSAMRLYPEICRLGMPLMFHMDVLASTHSKLEYARPVLIDEVAREFPDLRIIIAQLGYPWTEETIVILGKHENVFADISGLLRHPWHAYNALLSAYQVKVMDSLLFGSNFPFATPANCIESLYSITQFCHGTNLPSVPREQLRRIVERDVLGLLGIEAQTASAPAESDKTMIPVED